MKHNRWFLSISEQDTDPLLLLYRVRACALELEMLRVCVREFPVQLFTRTKILSLILSAR
jgi:hypothetical protein